MIGIDHTRAGIDVRTVFSFTKKKMAEALAVLQKVPGIEGCVLISTCNRMELWASTDDGFPEEGLYEQLCKIKEADPEMYRPYFVFRKEREAVQHLFWLAGGLEVADSGRRSDRDTGRRGTKLCQRAVRDGQCDGDAVPHGRDGSEKG